MMTFTSAASAAVDDAVDDAARAPPPPRNLPNVTTQESKETYLTLHYLGDDLAGFGCGAADQFGTRGPLWNLSASVLTLADHASARDVF